MEWISVKDKLPAYKKRVLLLVGNRIFIGERIKTDIYGEHYCDEQFDNEDKSKPEYWMELPEVPSKLMQPYHEKVA